MSEREIPLVDPLFAALLVWHVSSVAMWLGSSYYFVLFVWPSMRKMTFEERSARLRSFFPGFSRLVSGASVSALLAGTVLFGYVTSLDTSLNPTGWRLVFILIGAMLGLVSGFITLGVMLPMRPKIMKARVALAQGDGEKVQSRIQSERQDFGAMLRSVVSPLAIILSITAMMMVLGVFL